MDSAYLHLVTNHIPIIGIPFALIVLLLGIWRKSDELKAVALLAFAFLGLATLGVFLLGQGGEDFVEDLAGVSHDAIEDHEKMGLISLVAVGITAIFSAFGLIFYKGFSILKRRSSDENSKLLFPNWLTFLVLLLAILSAGILGYTGKLGGKIRHTEFYGGAVNSEEENEKNNEESESESGKGRGRSRGGRK
jgi:hypothetical protein